MNKQFNNKIVGDLKVLQTKMASQFITLILKIVEKYFQSLGRFKGTNPE